MFGIRINEELINERVAKIPMVVDKNFEIKEEEFTNVENLLKKFGEANYDSLAILSTNFKGITVALKSN